MATRRAAWGPASVVNVATLTFNHSDVAANAIGISGPGRLIHLGSGSLALTVSNTYSGGTTVSGGTLLANNTVGSGTGTGAVTVAGGATLGGTGIIHGPVTIGSGATIAPGNAVGTLTITNTLVVNNAATLQYNLGTSSSLLVVSNNLTLGGALNIANAGGFTAGTYTLIVYTRGLTYNGLSIGTAPAGYNYSIDNGTAGQVRAGGERVDAVSAMADELVRLHQLPAGRSECRSAGQGDEQ